MRSAFFEFNVARTALFLARGGLDVVNHNIASQGPGFSRQFIEHRALPALNLRDGRGMYGTGAQIYGVGQHRNVFLDHKFWNERSTLGRFQAQAQQLRVLEMGLNELRGADSPTGGVGTTTGFGLFFNSLQNLSTNAGDSVYRVNVLQTASTLQSFVHNMAQTMRRQQIDANTEVHIMVGRINGLGNQIASLNEQIARTELTGSRANDLRDSRARLIDELSLLVNVSIIETERNEDFAAGMFPEPEQRGLSKLHFRVMINGQDFVSGGNINLLETVARPAGAERNPTDVVGLFDIQFRGGRQFDMYSPQLRGQLRGLLDVRDGNNGTHISMAVTAGDFNGTVLTIPAPHRDDLNDQGRITLFNNDGRVIEIDYTDLEWHAGPPPYFTLDLDAFPTNFDPANLHRIEIGRTTNFKGIPHYMNQFNTLVRTFADAMNYGLNRNGQPIPGAVPAGNRDVSHVPGNVLHNMFVLGDDSNPNWRSQAFLNFGVNEILMQNPDWLAVSSNNNTGESFNDVILGFLAVNNYSGLFAQGRLQDFLISISGELGVDLRQALRFEENYNDIVQSVDIQRISVMGVDTSEEIVNMMRFQHIYQAAAQLINVIDGIYDLTINRLGNF